MDNLSLEYFANINLNDAFFDSLKSDYAEFSQWFSRKAFAGETAYVFRNERSLIDGFLYLKLEEGAVLDTYPQLSPAKRIKVGTLKINAHGTKLGERFLKKIFDHAIVAGAGEIYVTVFERQLPLRNLLARYGFQLSATKTTPNGTEQVLLKKLYQLNPSLVASYPLVNIGGSSIYLVGLHPEWHSRLLPDSILFNEHASIVQDVSYTNSIHKVYLTKMNGVDQLRAGDVLLIYRTNDFLGPAHYRSVATSICVVEEFRDINTFLDYNEFMRYCEPYSVFSRQELTRFWNTKQYPYIFRFTYNIALNRRVTRGEMIEYCGLDSSAYAGFMRLTPQQFHEIISRGRVNEDLVIY